MRLFRILIISVMFILITTTAAAFASATASTAPLENYVIRAADNSNGLVENGVNQVTAGLTFQQTPQIKVIPSITITKPVEHCVWIWHLPYLVQWKYTGLAPDTKINIDIYDQQGNFTQKYGANIPISQGADGYSCVLLGYSPPGDGYRLKFYCVQDPGIATWSVKFTIKKDP